MILKRLLKRVAPRMRVPMAMLVTFILGLLIIAVATIIHDSMLPHEERTHSDATTTENIIELEKPVIVTENFVLRVNGENIYLDPADSWGQAEVSMRVTVGAFLSFKDILIGVQSVSTHGQYTVSVLDRYDAIKRIRVIGKGVSLEYFKFPGSPNPSRQLEEQAARNHREKHRKHSIFPINKRRKQNDEKNVENDHYSLNVAVHGDLDRGSWSRMGSLRQAS